jgi:hypothetical protein
MGDSAKQLTRRGSAAGTDEVIHVVFKAELEADEEPVGRMAIVRPSELRERGADSVPGRQYGGVCVCREPDCDPGERCRRCGKGNKRWVTLLEAEEIARRRGVSLVEA